MHTRSRTVVLLALTGLLLVTLALPSAAGGVTQARGIGSGGVGHPACTAIEGADYIIRMDGDLDGCIYGFVTDFAVTPSGVYKETADETFVGCLGDRCGSFDMVENFHAKFDPETGAQQHGRCQHPIVDGSGTDGFAGVTGIVHFSDDVDAGNAPYRAQLRNL